jgi:hypothetical protein
MIFKQKANNLQKTYKNIDLEKENWYYTIH